MKKILISCLIILSFLPLQAAAQTVLQMDLFYDPRTNFRADRFVEDPIQVLENGQVNTVSETEGDYYVIYITSNGRDIDEEKYYFTPPEDAFRLVLPFKPEASGIRFFKSGRTTLLSQIDIQEFSKCNQNGVCSYEEGETINLCPQDCVKETTTFSDETQLLLAENGGEILSEDGTVLVKLNPLDKEPAPISVNLESNRQNRNQALIVLGGVVIGGLVMGGVIYKFYKK